MMNNNASLLASQNTLTNMTWKFGGKLPGTTFHEPFMY
jgi:hypothetical protein